MSNVFFLGRGKNIASSSNKCRQAKEANGLPGERNCRSIFFSLSVVHFFFFLSSAATYFNRIGSAVGNSSRRNERTNEARTRKKRGESRLFLEKVPLEMQQLIMYIGRDHLERTFFMCAPVIRRNSRNSHTHSRPTQRTDLLALGRRPA